MNDAARLSKLLWDARELADMYAVVLKSFTEPHETNFAAKTRDEIDRYRAERGWSPNGFGGEH